ncbi:MAG: hypothetical protein KIT58_19280 [Planctomycetota bacterium]|nr:hypothetical protein [Planctomycetota bacterium]
MLVGHYAPALLLRRAAPDAPLWALFLAVQALDLGFFALAAVGLEAARVVPGGRPVFEVTHGVYTHSLPAAVTLGLLCAVAGALARRPAVGAALGAAVASHWLADLVVHVPDLPLGFTQKPAVGLGLWRLPVIPWALELALLAGAWLLLRPRLATPARRPGDAAVAVLALVQLLHEHVVPTPSSTLALGASAYGLYLGAATLAWRVDRAARVSPDA